MIVLSWEILAFAFSLTVVSMFSLIYSVSGILNSIPCILMTMFVSMTPELFPRFSFSSMVFLCDVFIVSVSFLVS